MKILIYPHTQDHQIKWTCPRTELIIQEGFPKIPEVELVDNENTADYVIWHHVPQNHGQKSFELINRVDPKKLIIIDSIDENDQYFLPELDPTRYFLYFKRSLIKVDQNGNRSVIPRVERQYPWDYAILDGFVYKCRQTVRKDINIGCYLRHSCYYRSRVLQHMYSWNVEQGKRGFNGEPYEYVEVGEVSSGSRSDQSGKVIYDEQYFDYLARTRIIVSSGPYGWCGDSRGAEAVANKCFYLSNEFFDLMPNAPQPGVHYGRFNPLDANDLYTKLQHLLDNPEQTHFWANEGYKYCMSYHSSKARAQYILDKIKEHE